MKMITRNPEVEAVEVAGPESLEGFPGIVSAGVHCEDADCRLVWATENLNGLESEMLLGRGEGLVYLPHNDEYTTYDSWQSVVIDYAPVEEAPPIAIGVQLALDRRG